MLWTTWTRRATAVASISLVLESSAAWAADPPAGDLNARIDALQAEIAELRAQQHENWMTTERESQIRGIVQEVLKDARARGQFADGAEAGYVPGSGFYIQTPDRNFKLSIGGLAQVRYEYTQSNAYNGRGLPGRTVGSGTGATTVTPPDPGNSSGIDIRRARINFSGNVFSPDLTFKLEGDFYGGNYVNSITNNNQTNTAGQTTFAVPAQSSGGFTVTDAFIAYRFNDLLRVKVGSFKAPFAKAELMADPMTTFMERPEVLAPFDPVRVLGISLYGDIQKEKLSYEINLNNGSRGNVYRAPDTVGSLANIDNRPALYARVQWAGSGKISDFAEESDLRTDNRNFVWMLGAAGGYESQNATITAFPSPQNTASIGGLSNNGTNPGFIGNYALNGDVFRGTMDWSAKYQGLSINTAGYFQQINANPGNTSATSGTTVSTGPYGAGKASFFQYGGYGQVGYFVLPPVNGRNGLELTARAGLLGTEGYTNLGEFYAVGANYYVYGNNFKISSDVTFTPEAAYTDAVGALLQNTHNLTFRMQLQLRF